MSWSDDQYGRFIADSERSGSLKKFLKELEVAGGARQAEIQAAASERNAALAYAPGGSQDRTNLATLQSHGMQYGPGGQGDRDITALAGVRGAQATAFNADANLNTARTTGVNTINRMNTELYPDELAKVRSGYQADTMVNNKSLNPVSTALAAPRKKPSWFTGEMTTPGEEFSNYDNSPSDVGDWFKRRMLNIGHAPWQGLQSLAQPFISR
jgi:hypothetical protein